MASLHKLRHRFEVYPINLIYRSKLAACRIFAHGMRSWANGSCAFFFHHHCLQKKFSFSYFLFFIWYHILRHENELYIALYSFNFTVWLQSCHQVFSSVDFNDLSEQGFVALGSAHLGHKASPGSRKSPNVLPNRPQAAVIKTRFHGRVQVLEQISVHGPS